jgi:hypothetical protein
MNHEIDEYNISQIYDRYRRKKEEIRTLYHLDDRVDGVTGRLFSCLLGWFADTDTMFSMVLKSLANPLKDIFFDMDRLKLHIFIYRKSTAKCAKRKGEYRPLFISILQIF